MGDEGVVFDGEKQRAVYGGVLVGKEYELSLKGTLSDVGNKAKTAVKASKDFALNIADGKFDVWIFL